MIREMLSIAVTAALLAPAAFGQEPRKPSIKEQVLQIPTGSIVEVKTLAKEKIRGKLGETNEEGFTVQRVKNEQVETVSLTFQSVKSIKLQSGVESGGSKTGQTVMWAVVGGLAAVGVLAIVGLAMAGN
jgi:hypothetical protein